MVLIWSVLKGGVSIFNIFTTSPFSIGVSLKLFKKKNTLKSPKKSYLKFFWIEISLCLGSPTTIFHSTFVSPTTKFHSVQRPPTKKFHFIWGFSTTAHEKYPPSGAQAHQSKCRGPPNKVRFSCWGPQTGLKFRCWDTKMDRNLVFWDPQTEQNFNHEQIYFFPFSQQSQCQLDLMSKY